MAEPYLGEIRVFGFNFAPKGWAKCDGTLLLINQNNALYSLLGVRFGGDGRTNFGLPDFRGRVPMHRSSSYGIGEKGGIEAVAITLDTMPSHFHNAYGTTQNGDAFKPATNRSLATSPAVDDPLYFSPQNLVAMNAGVISATGGGQTHPNMQPCQVVNFCIATSGVYPPRS